MKLATKFGAALTIGAASVSSVYAGWEPIDDTHSWNTERVQVSGNDRTVFIKQTKSGKSPKGKRFATITTAQTIDCRSFSIRLKSIAFFDEQGNRVDGAELYAQGEETIYPDTVAEVIAQTVCARADGKASLGYADRVRRRVAPNIIFNGDVEGNPSTVVAVSLASDGSLLSARLTKSSGDAGWDNAVLRAVERSDPLPRDENGKAPANFTITFRPRD